VKNLKVVFIVVALAAAVLITVMYGLRDEPIPDTGENNSEWLCAACDHQFQLTPKEESEAGKKGPFPFPPTLCKKCNEHHAWRAVMCGECGYFFSMGSPEASGKCPRCYPEAKLQEDEWVDDEEEYEDRKPPPPVV
jgi:hypothetical protein